MSTASWAGSAGHAAPTAGRPVCGSSAESQLDVTGRGASAVTGPPALPPRGRETLGHLMRGPRARFHAGAGGRCRGACAKPPRASQEGPWLVAATGGKGVTGGPGEGFKDDCSSHGHARSRHYGTHRLVEVMNVPRAGGVMSGKLMTGWSAQLPASPHRAGGAVRGQRGRARRALGRLLPQEAGGGRASGLRDLLAARGAGREPGGGALLRAEAVLVLRRDGQTAVSVRAAEPCACTRAVGASLCPQTPCGAGPSQSPPHAARWGLNTGSASATTPAANTPADHVPGCRRSSPPSWREPHWQGQTWVSAQT